MNNRVIDEDLAFITGLKVPWKSLEGKRVLITGAGGFLPSYLVETLLYLNDHQLKDKVRIIALVRNEERALLRFAHHGGRSDLQFTIQDVCKPVSMKGEVDYIIHSASQASPKFYGSDPVGTLCPNALGTHYLLELAREKDSEGFLFFSSGEVYGEMPPDKVPTKESWYGYVNPTDVRSCYSESKRMGENMCVSWHHQYGIPAKIVRPFHTYGPNMRLDDGRVFADFIADLVNRRDIVMKSDGSARRAFCYLADATRGFFTVLLKGNAGEAYNIGNDKCEVSILELARELVAIFPQFGLKVIRQDVSPAPGYLKSAISRNCPDISKARSLGWEPEYSIRDGFMRTVQSFLDDNG
jgi:UDP-glucuronate decarboxylase